MYIYKTFIYFYIYVSIYVFFRITQSGVLGSATASKVCVCVL